MMVKRWLVVLAAIGILCSFSYLIGCSEDEGTPSSPDDHFYTADSRADCQGCHTNEDMLRATVEQSEVAQLSSSEGYPLRATAGDG